MLRVLKAGVVGAAILMIGAALGCGGGDSGSSAAEAEAKPRDVQKYDFIFHASIVCKKGLEQADVAMHRAAGEPAPKQPSSAPDWEGSKLPLKVVLPAFRRITSQLEALEPSKADAYDYNSFLSRLREELKEAEAHPGAPISSRPFARAGKQAYVWGLHACLF
ncbi:MAG: hypothetical protein QOJ58_4734 [Alphaproteobacteria bacterium]|jgi:hypothetical protein|nr:hypothetical protein [Alphaproteobacteria bacterium]